MGLPGKQSLPGVRIFGMEEAVRKQPQARQIGRGHVYLLQEKNAAVGADMVL